MGNWLRDDTRFFRVGIVGIVAGLIVTWFGSFPDAFGKWLFAMFFVAAGSVIVASGFRQYRRRRLVKRMPTISIHALATGLAELYGEVSPVDEPLQSPFSGEDCVLYEYNIEEYRKGAEGSGKFHRREQREERVPFTVDDGTGTVQVDPADATLRNKTENSYTVKQFDDLPETAQTFIQEQVERDDVQEKMTGRRRWRFTETYFPVGDDAYVFGKAMLRDDQDGSMATPENMVISADVQTPMFMITDRSEDELLNWLNNDIWGRIIGGGFFTIVAFAYLLHATGFL